MPVRVVDASALGALLFGEPQADEVARKPSGASLAAPAILWFEIASICLKKIRAHPRSADKLLAAMRYIDRLPLRPVEVDHAKIVDMARKRKLTTYDASYLWLAVESGTKLVTLDKKLARSARSLVQIL